MPPRSTKLDCPSTETHTCVLVSSMSGDVFVPPVLLQQVGNVCTDAKDAYDDLQKEQIKVLLDWAKSVTCKPGKCNCEKIPDPPTEADVQITAPTKDTNDSRQGSALLPSGKTVKCFRRTCTYTGEISLTVTCRCPKAIIIKKKAEQKLTPDPGGAKKAKRRNRG